MSAVTCPCGATVPVAEGVVEMLDAVGATLLCDACDQADIAKRTLVVDEGDARLNVERSRRIRPLLEAAGVPDLHAEAAIADPPRTRFEPQPFQTKAHAAAQAWARDGGILVLAGPMGTGKSTIAARAGLAVLARGGRLTWRSTAEAVSGLWANDTQVRDAAERLLYRGTGALILDELDTVKTTGAALETLSGLIDRWYAHSNPLLLTTNATGTADLIQKYGVTGQRIASRFSSGHWIDVDGPDLRKNQGGPN
jgi:DNA replication protein DnaC